jgi:hypothetical protein
MNANNTCTLLYKAYGGEAADNSGVSDGMNDSNRVERTWKMRKAVLITFFDIKGIVHFEFISQGQTVNRAYYLKMLKL